MILVSVIHTDNGDSPNTGSNLHLSNQVGQPDFKLGGNVFIRNTGPTDFSGTLTFIQSLLGAANDAVATITKDGPVTIPAGKSVDLLPGTVGSISMLGVDTKGARYGYRLTVKNGVDVISDTITGVSFDLTNTTFTSETTPFAVADTNVNARKELAEKETAMSANVKVISKAQDEIKVLQPRIDKLKALLT